MIVSKHLACVLTFLMFCSKIMISCVQADIGEESIVDKRDGEMEIDSDPVQYMDDFNCKNDPLKDEPGVCGCGVPDVDSDQDGVMDCVDECPADPNKMKSGICGCGISDGDGDQDGVINCMEDCPDDPLKLEEGICGCGVSDEDTDGDGVSDCHDECPTDPQKDREGQCGCGVSEHDGDKDGTSDCLDHCPADPQKEQPGYCGCGVSEHDSDGDGTPDCNDYCVDDPEKVDAGICGCGVSDHDSDADGTPDCIDGCTVDPAKTDPGKCGCGLRDTSGDSSIDYSTEAVAIFYESFESPVVEDQTDIDPPGWQTTGSSNDIGINPEEKNTFKTPYGNQALTVHLDGTATTKSSILKKVVEENTTYTLSFNVARNRDTEPAGYFVELMAIDDKSGAETVLAVTSSISVDQQDMSYSDNLVFTAPVCHQNVGQRIAIRIKRNDAARLSTYFYIDNILLTAKYR